MERKQIPQEELAKIASLKCPLKARDLALMFLFIDAWNNGYDSVSEEMESLGRHDLADAVDSLSTLMSFGLVTVSMSINEIELTQLEQDGYGKCVMKLTDSYYE